MFAVAFKTRRPGSSERSYTRQRNERRTVIDAKKCFPRGFVERVHHAASILIDLLDEAVLIFP
jgi:hypothetical protein